MNNNRNRDNPERKQPAKHKYDHQLRDSKGRRERRCEPGHNPHRPNRERAHPHRGAKIRSRRSNSKTKRTKNEGRKNMKAAIQVTALNISGHGNLNVQHHSNKWTNIWQMMRDQKIGVLITGEAHLNDKRRGLEYSKDPRTANAAGVAFVLNKRLVRTDGIKTIEIIPGRALVLEMQNADGTPLSILGAYAPNAPAENEKFWRDIQAWYEARPRVRRPDILGGDTNIVEDPIDRLPSRKEPTTAVTALDELKTYL
ncbi:hypothetical protein C8J57DRAFT_1247224 [Mycena rebaudengoi]|nr:hypothetical protein C8J57DRAFT_1247224 [Mycena rebaudengoi]